MIEVAAAVILKNKKVFISSRPENKPPAGWEFPGGKLEPGENAFDAVKREMQEELAWEIIPEEVIYTLRNNEITIYFVLCSPRPNSCPAACEMQHFKWVDISETPPDGLLKNDIEFWNFLSRLK